MESIIIFIIDNKKKLTVILITIAILIAIAIKFNKEEVSYNKIDNLASNIYTYNGDRITNNH